MVNKPEEATSLKQLLQGMQVKDLNILQGKVTQASPLKITVVNDDKLILTEAILIVPWHLTDYRTICDISLGEQGTINSVTQSDGTHSHSGGTHGGHEGGNGSHTHSGDGAHSHRQSTFSIAGASITVHNALKAGETVHLLAFDDGKKYYVLDRVV